MNFISLTFVFLFPLVVLLYWKLPWKRREVFLLAVSYFFYIRESSWAGGLLLVTTAFTYVAGRAIEKGRHKKGWLILTVMVCLGLLIGLKYSVPPVGISFYTFQTMSYVIDVYRGDISAEKDLISYALFVSFFPQLVAGPIERAGNLLGQFKEEHTRNCTDLVNGSWLIIRGFFKKTVVAGTVLVASGSVPSGLGTVLMAVLFGIQIYCDFSGYTDIARGAARMMGIHLMENFQHPYRATSIQDFWKRWHISLTRWFTDYVYIPLGGNRRGFAKRCRNVLIVFLLSGFWHGASWNFVVWGLFHGVCMVGAMCIERLRKGKKRILPPVIGWLVTMTLVNISWIFFRTPSISDVWQILMQVFVNPLGGGISETLSAFGIQGVKALRLLVVLPGWLLLERFPDEIDQCCQSKKKLCLAAVILVVMVTAIEFSWLGMMAAGGENEFIYFRF